MELKADSVAIEAAVRKIVVPDQVVELRALQVPSKDGIKRTFSGHFTDLSAFAEAAARLSNAGAKGVYFTPNPVRTTDTLRVTNKVSLAQRGSLTKDTDIESIDWLLIDVDPERKAGLSANRGEKIEAAAVLADTRAYLSDFGWPEPIIGDSGNGYHLMYRVEGASSEVIRLVLDALSFLFNTEGAKIDQAVYNPSRIWKVYGSIARKGEHSDERPWRVARLAKSPEEVVPVSAQQLQGLARLVPNTNVGQPSGGMTVGALDNWVTKHFPSLGEPENWKGKGRRWIFPVCPWDADHTDRSAYVVQFNNGAIAAGCLHENCKGNEKDDKGKSLGWKNLQDKAGEKLGSGGTGSGARGPVLPSTASTMGAPNLTDLGNAKRLVRLSQVDLLFCPTHGDWYTYDEVKWRRDTDGGVYRRAKTAVGLIFAEAEAESDPNRQVDIRRHAMRSESSRAINAMVSLASTEIEMTVESSRLDADPWLFNVTNGTLNLQTGELQPHDRTDLLTKTSPVGWDKDAQCPRWDAFIDYAMEGDQEVVEFLHRFFGYCLTGLTTEQVMLFMEGTGCNGKTTALLMLMHVLGDYAIQGAPGLLLAKQGESHPTEVADLEGTRFVANAEVEKGKPFAESLIKQLTGSDPVRARRMRQDFYQFMPTHKLCIAANHRPIIKGNDEGIWRRVIRIPWNKRVPDSKKDPFLLDKLKKEAPGILNRLVAGCLEWQQHGLQPPEKVTMATDAYREEMDVLAEFMDEHCLLGDRHRVTQKELYICYADWCEALRQRPQNYRLFNRQLKERNFQTKVAKVDGKPIRVWIGIGLRGRSVMPRAPFMGMSVADA